MPLLIAPLVVVALLGLWLLLLPLSLWQRYRAGKARHRALPWLVRLNGWALLLSLAVFVPGMALTSLWWPGALWYALAGLAAGGLAGMLGLRLCQFERTPRGLYYTPNRWLALGLILLVAARLVMSLVELWRSWRGRDALAVVPVLDHASLFAVAGVLLGYYMVFTWGLRRRLPADGA